MANIEGVSGGVGAVVEQLSHIVISALKAQAVVIVLGFGPLFLLGWWLHRKKARYKAEALEPFTELPLRPAGESVRLEIEKLNEKFDDRLMELVFSSVGVVVVVIASPENQRLLLICAFGLFVAFSYFRNAPFLFRTARLLWDYRLGFAGERVVAEELNQLLARGFRVFHDLSFDGFNIDHVIVGPSGVYAVETKTRRKPAHIKGRERSLVTYDGKSLQFPTGPDTKMLDQARLNASTLGKWLSKATGEPVRVSAILTLPGWFVKRTATGDVNVLNPIEIKSSTPTGTTPLSPPQIERIAYQLTERCRIPKEKTE